ncbi:ABC transporter permease [Mucilaginibacter boryungensis]|uniref:ABC transporter permease n=1 Tax=Mucilaginibacter boryungensis TaxID=768480 RepID=A0ABR9XJ80_9SPHI|nr:ABC transporter permease [Mucilaginibacter boryungensis]MBE9667260.1 ABC transporter permease [Mucilaginibacter boryungensis]
MFKSYFKTTFRFLLKNKTFSFINIIGLATGTLCCLYILLYVQTQFSYDKHLKDAQDIYRITTTLQLRGDRHNNATASPPIAPAMKKDFPQVLQYTRVIPTGTLGSKEHLLTYKEKSFYQKDVVYVDSTFFDVFTYHFVKGNSTKVLNEAYSIVLLKPVADKLFGNEDPIGKTISIDDDGGKHDFKVNGVVDESLGKSHIQANLFITMRGGGIGAYVLQNNVWAGNNFTASYVKLRPGTSAAALEKQFPAFLDKYGAAQMKSLGMTKQLHLQPVTSIHTTTGYEVELSKTLSPSFLYILLLIAVMIQVIACINFMNLSTARASKRAKEVGVRKVIGAGQGDLIKQFLGESFFLAFLGVVIALPLLLLILPYLNQITRTDIQLSFFSDYRLYLTLTGLVVVTGLVAGSYPAFYLSAFRTIKVIKGNFTSHVSVAGIRRSLVVFQFVLSIVLIAGIIVIYSQLNYIKNKDLGFEKSQRLIFSFYTGDTQKQMGAFMGDLKQLSDVKAVSKADNYLSQFIGHDHGIYLAGGNMAEATDAQNISTDEYFVKANGIKVIEGRDFRLNDSNRVLINETLAKRLGIKPGKALGTRLYSKYDSQETFVEVVGVMKDFNYNSLHGEVKPFMLMYNPNQGNLTSLIVAVNTTNYKSLLSQMEQLWHKDISGAPFEYTFLDDAVQKQYETEITLSNIINSFTLMAILISCLGLFGLAAFSAEQRSKEIGIRKVLGASIPAIAGLLSKDFLKLVIIAFVIATPIAWWGMGQWLQGFVYRVDISWWMFALAGLIAVIISLITVSSQALKAAYANPVKSLRTE